MRTFKLICSDSAKSQSARWQLQTALARAGFVPATGTEVPEFCIAVGGDGTFLRMVKECDFNKDIKFAGVNTGRLGFLQEVKAEELEAFAAALKANQYTEHSIAYLECNVGEQVFKCFNEVIIRDFDLRIMKLEIRVDGVTLGGFAGDGILVCTSVGSTGHNMSLDGALVPFEIDTMQITPIAPVNSAVYRSLNNSVIVHAPCEVDVIAERFGDAAFVVADGVKNEVKNFETMKIFLSKNRIKYIKTGELTFWEKINTKVIGNSAYPVN